MAKSEAKDEKPFSDEDHRLWFRCTKCFALSSIKNGGCCVTLPMGNVHTWEPVVVTVRAIRDL